MIIFKLLIAFLVPTIIGYMFVVYCLRSWRGRNIFENLIFGYGIGMGFMSFFLFILGVFRIPLTLPSALTAPSAAALLLSYLIHKSKMSFREMFHSDRAGGSSNLGESKSPIKRALIVFFAVWILLKAIFVIHEASILPVHVWDSFAMWSAGAKFFFYEKGLVLDPSNEHFFGWGERPFINYPLHNFLTQVWFALCLGGFHEAYVKIWNSFNFLSMTALLFLTVRRESSVFIALLSAFALSSVPLLTYHALDALSDLTVGFYALSAAVCFHRYITTAEKDPKTGRAFLLLTGSFVVMALWTKLEGLLFVLSFSAAVLLFLLTKKLPLKSLIPYFVPIAVVAVSWYSFLFFHHIPPTSHPAAHMPGAWQNQYVSDSVFHFEVLPVIFSQLISSANFNIIFPLFFAVTLAGWKSIARSGLKYLLAVPGGVMLMYLALYIGTEEYRWVMDLTALNRNILTFLPMVYFITALTITKMLRVPLPAAAPAAVRGSVSETAGAASSVYNRGHEMPSGEIQPMKYGKGVYLLAGILLIAVIATYSNHFHNAFQFDDAHVIVNNIFIKNIRNIPLFFKDGSTISSLPANQAYRPIVVTSLALDYFLGKGLNTFYFHLSMFVLFIIQGIFMYFLYFKVFNSSGGHGWNGLVALCAVAWYLLHPANAETINYISARSDLISTLFVIISLVLYIYSPLCRKWFLYLVPFAIGVLAKPIAIVFAFLLPSYLYFFGEHQAGKNASLRAVKPKRGKAGKPTSLQTEKQDSGFLPMNSVMKKSAPVFIFSLALMVFTKIMTPHTFNPGGAPFFSYVITQPYVILHYFATFFLPIGLSADTDWRPLDSMLDWRFFVGMSFLAILAYTAFVAAKNKRTHPVSFGILWFFITLLPTSLFPLAEVTNDHRIFFPFIGLTMSASWALFLAAMRMKETVKSRAFGISASLLILIALAGYAHGAHERNKVWKTGESLWRDVTEKSPKNGRGLMNYGLVLMAKADFVEAEKYFMKALEFSPQYSYLHINLGILKDAMGKPAEAEQYFKNAISQGPAYPECYFYYARFLKDQKRYDEAVRNLNKALELSAAHIDARHLLMEIYARRAEAGRLADLVKSTLQIAPEDVQTRSYLAALRKGSLEDMARDISYGSGTPEYFLELSLRYYRQGQFGKCIEAAGESLKSRPDYDLAYNNICAAYNALKQWDKAIVAGEKAVRLNPGNRLARNNLEAAKRQKMISEKK